jgi:hypothetical protein
MIRSKTVVATAVYRTLRESESVLSLLRDVESWPKWAGVVRAEARNDAGRTSDLFDAHELILWFSDGREVTEQITFHGRTLHLVSSTGHGVLRVEDTADGSRLSWTSQMKVRGPRFIVRRVLRRRLCASLERLAANTPA